MKRFFITVLLIAWGLCASAVERSQTIVYINGSKYYVHTVRKGETVRALSQAYGVSETAILSNNPTMRGGLKEAANIKIPYVAPSESSVPQSERKLRKMFDRHTVAKGETFYSISRRYEIPVSTLMADNPSVDPAQLRLGESLLIRKTQIGTEDAAGSQAEWEEYRDRLNSLSGDSVSYHIVQPGDTFYSLARRFQVSEQQLSELNNGLNAAGLRIGAMIRIPDEQSVVSQPVDAVQSDSLPESFREVPQIMFRCCFPSRRKAKSIPITWSFTKDSCWAWIACVPVTDIRSTWRFTIRNVMPNGFAQYSKCPIFPAHS